MKKWSIEYSSKLLIFIGKQLHMYQCNRNKPKMGLPVRASCTGVKTKEQDNLFFHNFGKEHYIVIRNFRSDI